MKNGRTLQQVLVELARQQESKRDLIADTRQLEFASVGGGAVDLIVPGDGPLPILPLAHRQIGLHTQVPAKYYDRMMTSAPDLLVSNLNHWFKNEPARRMVRTMDGQTRAFLSDAYARIENLEVANVVLPVLAEYPDLRIESCEVTSSKLYIKVVNPRIEGEVEKGDVVQAGVVISNSEVGMGALSVQPLVFRLVCLNGMIRQDMAFRKTHVGSRADVRDDVYELLSTEAKEADDRAVLLKVRDMVRGAMSEAGLAQAIGRMQAAAGRKIEGDVPAAIEVLGDKYRLTDGETSGVLRHLIEGGSLSQWGVVNAITRFAQDVESYDRSTELEALGGRVLDLAPNEWKVIATAAA